MSKLVFDAIGKYVHPTRYWQIVETVSSKKLSSNAQGTISEDQKHSSVVARVHNQEQRSREIATKAQEYLETLYGEKESALEMDVRSRFSNKSASSPEQEENDDGSVPEEHNILITPTNSGQKQEYFENTRFFDGKENSTIHSRRGSIFADGTRTQRFRKLDSYS